MQLQASKTFSAEMISIDRCADLISTIGSSTFGAQYFGLFREFLGIDQCTVFAFKGQRPPSALILEGRSAAFKDTAQSLASQYIAGGFNNDPNVQRQTPATTPLIHCLQAEELPNRSYRYRFYEQPRLAHELVVLYQADDTLYYSSFYRQDRRARFGQVEMDMVHRVGRFVVNAIARHDALVSQGDSAREWLACPESTKQSPEQRRELQQYLTNVLLSEPCRLSPRESQVCAGIILGYTTLGISLNFDITVHTVATHRKRAYKKLAVSSQNELFSRYFRIVNQYQARALASAARLS